MKTTTILAGLFATAIAAIEGRAKHNATAECAERFERDDALKTAVLEHNATVADMCAGATGEVSGAGAGSSDTLAGSSDTGSSVAKLDTPHNPPTLNEMLRYIGCGDCRDRFNKCMNQWSCWFEPSACAITCQCDVIREDPECKGCGFKC